MHGPRSWLDHEAIRNGPIGSIALGALVAAATFALLGTVSALWANPLFIRMTPAGDWELAALATLSLLAGAFVAIPQPACSTRTAGIGGVLGFLGIACPVCNKILVFLVGGELLLAYFEPIRIYAASAGVVVLAFAVQRRWAGYRAGRAPDRARSLPTSEERS